MTSDIGYLGNAKLTIYYPISIGAVSALMIEATMSADVSSPAGELSNLHFGFRHLPFQDTDSQNFFTSSGYVNAYNQLLGAIRQQWGVVAVVGESGIGKTLLLTKVMQEAPEHLHFVFCPAAHLAFDDLLEFLCEALQATAADDSRAARCRALAAALSTTSSTSQRVLLVIDNAHALGDMVLGELLRLLRQLRRAAPMQLILGAESSLVAELHHEAALHPLAMNALVLTPEPLSEVEVATYIRWQLKLAGGNGDTLFPIAAIRRVYRYAGGVPRRINALCYRALSLAQQRRQSQVTVSMITEAARAEGLSTQALPRLLNAVPPVEDNKPQQSSSRRRLPGRLLALGAAVVMGSAGAFWLEQYLGELPAFGNSTGEQGAVPQPLVVNEISPPRSQPQFGAIDNGPLKPPVENDPPVKPEPIPWDRSQMAAEYLRRGDRLLELGDVAAARQFYQTAADQGSSAARVAVGKTFDPLVLEARGLRGVYADPSQAAEWYRAAHEGGEREALTRLRALERAALLDSRSGS